jgi:hypothetical protein
MKRFLGLAILILGLSIPAHAQRAAAGMTGGAAGGALSNGGGGGGYGGSGGGIGGSTSLQTLPSIPPARLPSTAVSGSDATFEPSTFLPYNQAIAAGEAMLDAQHESVAEAAAKNSLVHRLPAKATIIENATGNPVITTP